MAASGNGIPCVAFSLLLFLVCILSCCSAAKHQKPGQAAARPLPPFRTSGRYIVGSNGVRLKLKCASWSGGQEKWYAPSGLWAQDRSAIAVMARKAGLNCIRLVWSLEMALKPGAVIPKEALKANPDLIGKAPLEVFDAVIKAIAAQGLYIIIDNHSSDAIWCCNFEDGNGMWYTDKWSEQQWLQGWQLIARRYANNPAVIGAGLRNEPRPALVDGQLKWPMWGGGVRDLDLALAYERAAAVVLAARSTYLIFAQGNDSGRDLESAAARPLVLRSTWPLGTVVRGQLVYEVHEYSWFREGTNVSDYAVYSAELDTAWGYLVNKNITPVWVGEFGTTHDAPGLNTPWWKSFTRYIREKDLDWAYWPLDGQQGPSRAQGTEETFGLLNMTWNGWAHEPLLKELAALG